MAPRPRPAEERFLEKVCPDVNSGCWLWSGFLGRGGYGQFRASDKTQPAHRFSYEFYNGLSIGDKSMCVCHKCDTPSCVNPNHLFLGSFQENMDDMKRKGRNRVGSDHASAKLDDDGVVRLRALIKDGVPQRQIAKILGVSQSAVSHINTGRNRKHGRV